MNRELCSRRGAAVRALSFAVFSFLAVTAFARPVCAQETPVPGSYRLFSTPLAKTMGLGDATFDLGLAYDASAQSENNALNAYVAAALGLGRAELGIVLPATLYHYVPVDDTGMRFSSPTTLGDLQVHVKGWLTPEHFPVNIGVHAFGRLPTHVTGENPTIRDTFQAGVRVIADATVRSRFTFALAVGYLVDVGLDPANLPGYMPDPMFPSPGRGYQHKLDVALGTQISVLRGRFDLFGELRVISWLNTPEATATANNGVDCCSVYSMTGGKLYLPHNLTAFAGVGHAWIPLQSGVTIFAGLTYEFRRGGQKAHMLPPDRDEDGVYDDEDKCPDEPGEEEDDPDRDGCPQHAGATATQDANSPEALAQRLQDGILMAFEPGSVEPAPSVKALIAQLAPIILQHPEWPGVLVAGYSDGTGAPDEQFKLSAARAEAVRLLLVAGKIPEDRLWADGFGTAAPRRRKGEFYSRGFVKIRIATANEGGGK